MDHNDIITNSHMNLVVKDTLKMRNDDNISLYALKRIEELEQTISATMKTLQDRAEIYERGYYTYCDIERQAEEETMREAIDILKSNIK